MRVVCNPGHGSPDPGGVGPSGLKEADVTIVAAQKLNTTLAQRKRAVVFTCNSSQALDPDNGVDLAKRVAASDNAGADCFVSIHCNAVVDHSAGGFEVFQAPSSKQGERLAHCIMAAVQAAELVQGCKDGTGYRLCNRGVKQAAYYVTRRTKAPAVLIELAFVSNLVEEALLKDLVWMERMAQAIADGTDARVSNQS